MEKVKMKKCCLKKRQNKKNVQWQSQVKFVCFLSQKNSLHILDRQFSLHDVYYRLSTKCHQSIKNRMYNRCKSGNNNNDTRLCCFGWMDSFSRNASFFSKLQFVSFIEFDFGSIWEKLRVERKGSEKGESNLCWMFRLKYTTSEHSLWSERFLKQAKNETILLCSLVVNWL